MTLNRSPECLEDGPELVAIKTYQRDVAATRSGRIVEEKQCLVRLSHTPTHPYTMKLLGTAKDDVSLHFLLSPVLGGSLHKHVTRRVSDEAHNLSLNTVRWYAAEVVSALRFLASRGVVHRDIKLNNLLLDERGHAILCDFSSAKMLCAHDIVARLHPRDAKRTFTVTGSLHNMAPEMAAEICGHSFPVDWWALGVLIHEMLTGSSFPWDRRQVTILKESALHALQGCEDTSLQGCWDWQSILPVLADLPCYTPTKPLGLAARDLVGKLLTIRPERRLEHFSDGGREIKDEECCFDDLFTRLQVHAFFDGIDWDRVHAGTSPSPWPDFDRRLGFLDLLATGGDADASDSVTADQQALFVDF